MSDIQHTCRFAHERDCFTIQNIVTYININIVVLVTVVSDPNFS